MLSTQWHRMISPMGSGIGVIIQLVAWLLLGGVGSSKDNPSQETRSVVITQTMELLNGLRTTTAQPVDDANVVVHLLIKSGFLADPHEKEGLAFLTGQSLLTAKQKPNAARWKDELNFLGATLSLRVDADSTIFRVHMPKAHVEPVLSLLADLILHPVFSDEMMAETKKDLAAGAAKSPDLIERAREELLKLMFSADACGRSQQKDLESMARLAVSEVEDFHRAYYRPNNAELIVVGAIPLTQISDVVREKFGSWVKIAEPPTRSDPSPARISDSIVRVIDYPNADRALILLGYPLPAKQSPDYPSLKALGALLEGIGPASRLQQAFLDLDRRQIFLKSELSFSFNCSSLQIQIEVPPSSVNATIHHVLDAITGSKTKPASGEEMSLIKSHLLEERDQKTRSDDGLANLITEVELFGLGRHFLSDLSPQLELLTSEKIQEVSKTYLSASRLAMVVAGGRERIDPELKEFGVQYIGSP